MAGRTRYNLLLALNLVLFAALLLWIGARLRSGAAPQDTSAAAEREPVVTRVPFPHPGGDLDLPDDGWRPEQVPDDLPEPVPQPAEEPLDPVPPTVSVEPMAPKTGPASLPGAVATDPPPTEEPPTSPDSEVPPVPTPVERPEPPRDHAPDARGNAESEIARLGLELEILKTVSGYYPSSLGGADDSHRGNEALYAALPEAARNRVATARDTDGDGRPEFLDPWGRPYVFTSADDYENPQRRFDAEGRSLAFTPVRIRRGFAAQGRYQLLSLGGNGVDDRGAGDDLVSWGSAQRRR